MDAVETRDSETAESLDEPVPLRRKREKQLF